MPKTFTITTTAADTIKSDAKGHAEAVFTVTNTTSRPVRGMAKATPVDGTKQDWLKVSGEADRDFAAGGTQQYVVTFDAPVAAATSGGPPAGDAAAGPTGADKYGFRLDVALATNPDEDFTEGQTVNVELPKPDPKPAPKPFPKWIIPIIAVVVLLIIGVVLWLVLRGGGKKTYVLPVVANSAEADAKEILETGCKAGEKCVVVKVEQFTDKDNTVAKGLAVGTNPKDGSEVDVGSEVTLLISSGPSAPPEASPTPKPAPTFNGNWVNSDKNTNGVTRLDIQQTGNEVKVHAFGKCSPKDCDWGTEKGALIGNTAQVTWDQGYSIKKMVLTLNGDTGLKMVLDTVFNDTRPRQHSEADFTRQKRPIIGIPKPDIGVVNP